MERTHEQDNKKSKINRIISYIIIVASCVVLVFCAHTIISYVVQTNKNATLSKNLETLKQDSNYLREHFDVLSNEDYYSVYIEGEYQYVDSNDDSVEIIN